MTAKSSGVFYRLSIKSKIFILVCLFTLIVGAVFLLGEMRSDILSGARGYVGGEGLWSKAQKNAVESLLAYAESHSEADYQRFLEWIAIPKGDEQARLELQKTVFDRQTVTQGLLQGHNDPSDIPSMVRLFRRFQHTSYMSKAIQSWTAGDRDIDNLVEQGAALHQEINSGYPSRERINQLRRNINSLDTELTRLEDEFSSVLAEGARWIQKALTAATLVCTILLVAFGVLCSALLLEQIRQSDIKYRHIFRAANDALFVIDADDETILDANTKAAELLATPYSQIVGTRGFPFCPPQQSESYRQFFREVMLRGSATTDHLHLLAHNGGTVPVEISATLAEWDKRQVLFVVFRNIRERQEAQEKLRASEERFRALIQNLSDIILVVNNQGEIVFQSPSVERVLGYNSGDLQGQNFADYAHPDDARTLQFLLPRPEQQPPVTDAFTFRCRKADDSWVWLETVANNLNDVPGVNGIVLTARDISERRMLEEEMRGAQKMEAVGRLAGGVAHDFNNLLMIVQGHAERVLGSCPDSNVPLRKHMESILKASARASNLTRRLLTFSRKQAFSPKVVDLNAILTDMEGMLRSLLSEHIRLKINLESALCLINADPEQIEQIVINLVVNARDAMPKGGSLVIETSCMTLDEGSHRRLSVPPGPYVMLAISDTGEGMDAQTKERIFEPFFSTKPKNRGTGLGLSIVFGIAKQSGGDVSAYSEPGEGSLFEIFLPRVTAQVESPYGPEGCEPAVATNETVLVVEDEDDLRMIICGFLTTQGYRVLEAENGNGAMAVSAGHAGQIHLLLTDIMMPGMRGTELAKLLVAERGNMKVLYTSGYSDTGTGAENGNERPRDETLLRKPFHLEELAQRISQTLRSTPEPLRRS